MGSAAPGAVGLYRTTEHTADHGTRGRSEGRTGAGRSAGVIGDGRRDDGRRAGGGWWETVYERRKTSGGQTSDGRMTADGGAVTITVNLSLHGRRPANGRRTNER